MYEGLYSGIEPEMEVKSKSKVVGSSPTAFSQCLGHSVLSVIGASSLLATWMHVVAGSTIHMIDP
jgi:hypothetical protein